MESGDNCKKCSAAKLTTRGFNNNKSYDEGDILRLMAQGLGLPTTKLGWAEKGVNMADFFSPANFSSSNDKR
jgi:hypothetical protein